MTIQISDIKLEMVLYTTSGAGPDLRVKRHVVTGLTFDRKTQRPRLVKLELTGEDGKRTRYSNAMQIMCIAQELRKQPPEWRSRGRGKGWKDRFEYPFECPMCGALTADKRDRSAHEWTCLHPAARR